MQVITNIDRVLLVLLTDGALLVPLVNDLQDT